MGKRDSSRQKIKIEAINKRMEGIMEMENWDKRTRTTDSSITNRMQEMEEKISGLKIKYRKWIYWSKKNLNITES